MDRERPAHSHADEETVRLLRDAHSYVHGLPPDERQIATMAADGSPVWEIAQQMRISDEAVAHALDRIVATLSRREVSQVETGGLGADTDPGVTGGYDPDPIGS